LKNFAKVGSLKKSMTIDTTKLPKSFGPYTLKQQFSGGGMAEIYLAETEGPGGFVKPLVIKTIHPAYVNDERFSSMFTEEAKILSSLSHGNIVPIFDFGSVDDMLYLAMEFIDGVDAATLMEVCRSEGFALPLQVALYIGIGTAAGLSCAHQAENPAGKSLFIVHRDISPQNILLSRSGEVKLCDFGLATRSREDISTDDATNDDIKGKLNYLSPEQAGGLKVDNRSDLFSLGVVLYELIAGHHPIPSGAGVSVLRELVGGSAYPSLGSAAPWIPKEVCDIIDRALAFDRQMRFETAEEMRAALAFCLHRDFPDFSPETLAALVIRAQTAALTFNGEDENGIVRARLASFASVSRMRTSSAPRPRKRKAVMWLVGASILVIFVLVGVLQAKRLPALRPDNTDANSERRPISSVSLSPMNSVDNTSTPGHVPKRPLDTADTASDIGTGEPSSQAPSPVSTAVSRDEPTSDKENPSRKPKAFGLLNINASPWADIEIDGRDYEGCPLLGVKLSAGKHKAVLKNAELKVTRTRYFTVKPNETSVIVVDMESSQ
jgi:serine/threonine-protein kinase